MQILDGKIVSQAVKDSIKEKTARLKEQGKKTPHLAAVLVGEVLVECRAIEWPECCDWSTARRSGTKGEVLRPARRMAYRVVVACACGVVDGMSLGYGSSFGLGVLRGRVGVGMGMRGFSSETASL